MSAFFFSGKAGFDSEISSRYSVSGFQWLPRIDFRSELPLIFFYEADLQLNQAF
jgi:hypothetical protein